MQVIRYALLISASALAAAQSGTPAPVQTPPATEHSVIQVWQMQESGTNAGLRGIDSVDGKVAWASGTGGTVLKTIDGGAHWQKCAVPDADKDGATLDFRGVQVWDTETAFVMSSGRGKLSRLYKTKDGCRSWKKIFTNPDKEGFWDALLIARLRDGNGVWNSGWILGDPVRGSFSLFSSYNAGNNWTKQKNKGLRVRTGAEGAFAASNSSLCANCDSMTFGTGGTGGALVYSGSENEICIHCPSDWDAEGWKYRWNTAAVPLGEKTDSSGVFSIAARSKPRPPYSDDYVLVAVGGDYSSPNEARNTAAFRASYDQTWTASTTPPHGYRSTVQWSESLKLWITVGTNGSDLSHDDGKTWQPLDDGNWNALSLPFVVGPNGRIGRLNPSALPQAK